ncbi:hypothetical protein M408DRAFT_14640 [Serendipita vermifera MAFF 305830]|uniref:Uncharacterized protein n=1 Tax=Serendipita vermifera MAFF 305830 TaxID=933852 RepID=A0A0C2X1M3_SERVB|nr:hypothetical protein M408DRAFT_14640 [Serendipita vermifera MAFF 305830]
MPRLLRRLARYLEAESSGKIKFRQRQPQGQETEKRPAQPLKKRLPITYRRDRDRSFLLDVNPLIEKELYEVPKERAPLLPSEQRMPRPADGRRAMNQVELDAAASPYMRMLCSPLRTCLFTRAILPNDMLIRFGGALDPETNARYLLPNNIEHPKYSEQAKGRSFWVSCRKEAVKHMVATGMHGMILPNLNSHSMITEQIEELLQKRLVQELELLRDRLLTAPRQTASLEEPVIRTLTSEELEDVLTNSGGDLTGGAAILLFQEEPDQPKEQGQPEASASSHPIEGAPLSNSASRLITDRSSPLPARFVPLYDTATFLSIDIRRNIQSLLKDILRTEMRARRRIAKSDVTTPEPSTTPQPDRPKGPQAYLLRSTSKTLHRADTVPVCIALWRLRLWAGQGWSKSLWGPWEVPPYIDPATNNP